MKLRWWYGLVLNLLLAALAVWGAAMYVLHYKENPNWKNAPAPVPALEMPATETNAD